MPRQARQAHRTKYFHVMVQGVNREYIFQKEIYKKKYLYLLKKAPEYNIKIISYCIMDNHVHLLIETENSKNMSEFMGKIDLLFAMYFNHKEERVGVVFRNRYTSEPIYTEEYLRRCIAYIHRNPVKANMVKRLEEYKYSSYKSYVEGVMQNDIFYFNSKFDLKSFDAIHNSEIEDKFIEYIGTKNDAQTIMQEFLDTRNIQFAQLRENKGILKELAKRIKKRCNATNKDIAKVLDISSATIGNYLKN